MVRHAPNQVMKRLYVINIYFDYEDATPDDAGSDCMTNWYHFSRRFTGIEVERAMEDKKDG